ncbi:MAG TPA: hypothetical protein VJQ54_06220 [Candidatus Sulfotelmatobacter sp.]|nr:hypothetical protein [Candidatus Sulfotelmatobacter sp.]
MIRIYLAILLISPLAAGQNWPTLPAPSPSPGVSLSVNYSADSHVMRGWPVFARARISHPQRSLTQTSPVFLLAPSIATMTGSWADAVTLKVTSANGTQVKWAFQRSTKIPSAQLQLTPLQSAIIEWQMAAEATRAIPPGQYFVQAVLNATGASGWSGTVESSKVSVRVNDEPASPKESDRYMKTLLIVDTSGNDLDQAFSAADTFYKAFPQNVPGMELKARVLEAQKKYREARDLAGKALQQLFDHSPAPKEPPVSLLELYNRLDAEASNDSVVVK